MEPTFGYWEPIMTHVDVETQITISSETSSGQELTRDQSTSFGTSISSEFTVEADTPVGGASATVGFEFSTDYSFGSSKTASNSVTYG
jgi:hypothetical protein